MGPRHKGRGNALDHSMGPELLLQLQWGRVTKDAEMVSVAKAAATSSNCFNGAASQSVKGRLNPATMGAFKTSHFESRKICLRYSPIPTITGFKESTHGKSTQNGYGKRSMDIKTTWLV
jgi:hypothetical protein